MQVREREDKGDGKLFRPWAPRGLQTTVNGHGKLRTVAATSEPKGLINSSKGLHYPKSAKISAVSSQGASSSCSSLLSSVVTQGDGQGHQCGRTAAAAAAASLASSHCHHHHLQHHHHHLVLPMGPIVHQSSTSSFSIKERCDHLGPSDVLRPPLQVNPCLQPPKTNWHSSSFDGRHNNHSHYHRSHQFTMNDNDMDGVKLLKKQRPKRFQCPHCQVAFSNNGQLKGHVRIHTGERPFKCDNVECGKTFTRNEELTRHKRIHSGLRPYACHVCSKKFGRKDHLKKHVKTHQQKTSTTTTMSSSPGGGQHLPTLMTLMHPYAIPGSSGASVNALMAAAFQQSFPTSSSSSTATVLPLRMAGPHETPERQLIFW